MGWGVVGCVVEASHTSRSQKYMERIKCEGVNGTRTKKGVSACAYFGCCFIKIMNECDLSYCAAAGAISAF